MPDGAGGSYLTATIRGGPVGAISSVPEGAPASPAWTTYISVDDADATAQAVVRAGGSVVAEPFDVPGAGRMAILADTEVPALSAWQARAHGASTVVTEHPAVDFNGRATSSDHAAHMLLGREFGGAHVPIPGDPRGEFLR